MLEEGACVGGVCEVPGLCRDDEGAGECGLQYLPVVSES